MSEDKDVDKDNDDIIADLASINGCVSRLVQIDSVFELFKAIADEDEAKIASITSKALDDATSPRSNDE